MERIFLHFGRRAAESRGVSTVYLLLTSALAKSKLIHGTGNTDQR